MNVMAPDSPGAARPLVGSILQAVAVLRHLGSAHQGQGVTAIAKQLGISPSSCFNVLKTLVHEDLVTFDPVAKTYALGLGSVDIARVALGRDAVVKAAYPVMQALAARYDAAIGLWRLSGRERLMLVALAESESATRIHLTVGQRQPATAGATGRAVLAARGLDRVGIAVLCGKVRWQKAPSPEDFAQQVMDARERGWAVDVAQINRGVTTVAAPLLDAKGAIRFCLSASMFTGRDTVDRIREIGEGVRDTAFVVAHSVYGQGGSA